VATNLDINSKLIEEARRIGNHKSKKDAVTEALKEYVRSKKQMRIFELAGKIDFDPTYDYKKERNRH
jgi:Arc/MetJ family transcription regulator